MRALATTILSLLILAALPAVAAGQASYIHLRVDDRAALAELTRLVSIDDVRGLEVRAYATPQQLRALRAAGYAWTEVPERKRTPRAIMCPAGWADDPAPTWDCYPTYAQYFQRMLDWTTAYPEISRLELIGTSTNQNRRHELLAIKISDHPNAEEDEPEVFYTSTMHGDETTGYVVMLRLVEELLSGYGSDPEITDLVDRLEIWINPLANPDGTYFGSDADLSAAIRYYTTASGASSGVDPNRNFPDPDDGDHPDGHPWWAETEAMMAFADAHSFVLAANFHGGAEVVNYPWDTWSRRHPDDLWYVDLARAYADQAQIDGPPGYMTDLDDGITNGWDWYPIAGGRQDYMNYWHGCRETTIELSAVKLLPASQLPAHWSANRQALLDYLAAALAGVRGVVTDFRGQPLAATVEVVGWDTPGDNSYVDTDPEVGDYHRMLVPGTYDLRFGADGFPIHEVPGVVVGAGEATRLDVVMLRPGDVFADGFESGDTSAWSATVD